MPLSIVLTLVALMALIGPSLLAIGVLALQKSNIWVPVTIVALGFPLYMGILRRHRRTWQLGRVLILFGAVFFVVFGVNQLVLELRQAQFEWTRLFAPFFGAAVLFTALGALARPSAQEYFKLRCPQCQALAVEPADFRFKQAKCQKCQHVF